MNAPATTTPPSLPATNSSLSLSLQLQLFPLSFLHFLSPFLLFPFPLSPAPFRRRLIFVQTIDYTKPDGSQETVLGVVAKSGGDTVKSAVSFSFPIPVPLSPPSFSRALNNLCARLLGCSASPQNEQRSTPSMSSRDGALPCADVRSSSGEPYLHLHISDKALLSNCIPFVVLIPCSSSVCSSI